MPIDSTDGAWGELDDFVVDPTNWHVTHLVVQPRRHHDQSRLVPADRVSVTSDRLTLAMSATEIEECPHVEVTEFVRVDPPTKYGNGWTSSALTVSAWPYYPSASSSVTFGGSGFVSGYSTARNSGPRYVATQFDHVPIGEVEIRRASKVVSSDGHTVGTVDGFVFDDADRITHLVLDHGHLWGHREVTIPIEHAVEASSDRVSLDVTRHATGEFPSVAFHRHARVKS